MLIVDGDSKVDFEEALTMFQKEYGVSDIILKGVIDTAASGYLHVDPSKPDEAKQHFEKLKTDNYGAIIQSFIPQVYEKGELSFVFLDGKLSYYFLKVPKYNEERVQAFHGGKSFHFENNQKLQLIELVKSSFRSDLTLTEADINQACVQAQTTYAQLLNTLDSLGIPHPQYLRMDGVLVGPHFTIMELEGIEPYLEIQEEMTNNPSNNVLEAYIQAIKAKN